ncbi:MAG TPA: hypothetical protein VER79_12230 [Candidatus Limnocylindrales bacterium]|nr:hypothetical protein [Candidatus Limnocylindrales bacterium]
MNTTALLMPRRVWLELPSTGDADSCDALVETENGVVYTAMFVTMPFFERQMQLSYEVSKSLPECMPLQYATLETPHVVVPDLRSETIEDAIDNMIALDTFLSVFTQVTDDEPAEHAPATKLTTLTSVGKRTTAEVAAVIIGEVLCCDPTTGETC